MGLLERVTDCSHLVRAAHYAVATDGQSSRFFFIDWRIHTRRLPDFDILDQTQTVPLWLRRRRLSLVSELSCHYLMHVAHQCADAPTRNPMSLHLLRRVSDKVLGPHQGAQASAYVRRAALRLHPDKTGDLEGWTPPEMIERGHTDPRHTNHALRGARGLFGLLLALERVHSMPHYQQALTTPQARLGGALTKRQLAVELVKGVALGSALGACGVLAVATIAYWLRLGACVLVAWAGIDGARECFDWYKQPLAMRQAHYCRTMVKYTGKEKLH